MRKAWPATHVVLVTPTPCSPSLVRIGDTITSPKPRTPAAGCALVANFTDIMRRIGDRHGHVRVVDANQMTRSHPAAQIGGAPGVWDNNANSWHFKMVTSKADRDAEQNRQSAAGELDRAIANRLLDHICPHHLDLRGAQHSIDSTQTRREA